MHAGILLADIGNLGLLACAAIDTTAVIAYAVLDSGERRGKWWKTPFGVHLMCFMVAFAVVLDQSAIYLLVNDGPLVSVAPPGRPDWFAWERVLSFALLIPLVLGWRLLFIVRPPAGRKRGRERR